MRVGLVDCNEPKNAVRRMPSFPSPALLQAGARATAEGDSVTYLSGDSLASAEVDRVILLVPPWRHEVAAEREAALAGRVPCVRVDPWKVELSETLPQYLLAREDCHGEVDMAPGVAPVHPWIVPSAATVSRTVADARLRAAVAGLAGVRNTSMVVGDERIPLTEDRLRFFAELISGSLRDRKSLVHLHLRAWPADLLGERMLDHLSLLSVASLDLLLGTLNEQALRRMESPLTAGQLTELVAGLAKAGLAGVTTLSIVAALPGETIEHSVAALNTTLQLAAAHRIAAVRCSLWLGGDGVPPSDPEDQKKRFLASHYPIWTEAEYRGFHDLVAVIRQVAKGIELIGPGFLPSWDEVP